MHVLIVILFAGKQLMPFIQKELLGPGPLSSQQRSILQQTDIIVNIQFRQFIPLLKAPRICFKYCKNAISGRCSEE